MQGGQQGLPELPSAHSLGLASKPSSVWRSLHLTRPVRCALKLTNFIVVQGGQRGLPALPSVPDIGLSGMPAIALPENPGELWAPLPAPNENNIFATRPAEAVKPYSSFYRALPTVTDSAIKPEAGRKLAQIQPNDPSKPAQPFGYRLVLVRSVHQNSTQFCEHAQQCSSSQHGYQTLVSCEPCSSLLQSLWSRDEGYLVCCEWMLSHVHFGRCRILFSA